jgi:glutamyl-tRNA reductase
VTLLAVGITHRTAPVGLRERVGVTERQAPDVLGSLVASGDVSEAVLLSTCNRTELYLTAADPRLGARAAADALRSAGDALRTLRGSAAVRHLFRVAAGLDSMILGEAEIQGQVKRAYELAVSLGTGGPQTNRLFQAALCAGKRARSETGLSRRAASVASVAVELARAELEDLRGRRALVIGAGKHGTLTANALRDAGVHTVFVASRDHDLAAELPGCDLILTCTSCPHRVLTCQDLERTAASRRVVIVDTAVPRDVEPAVRKLPGVTLYDLDDIQRAAERNLEARAQEALLAEPIIEEEVARFDRWLASLEVAPTISALRRRGRDAIDRAFRQNEGRWRALADDDRARVELLANAIVSDLLHEPTLKLRQAGERGSSASYADALRELFDLGGPVEQTPRA